jgi:hypothetical protein
MTAVAVLFWAMVWRDVATGNPRPLRAGMFVTVWCIVYASSLFAGCWLAISEPAPLTLLAGG